MSNSLTGVRVLDLSRYLPGGYLTRLLADLGADVIKIEAPPFGDPGRLLPPLIDGTSAVFIALEHGKRAMGLDLKAPEGQALLKEAVRGADVLVESFRPGVLERLGVGAAVMLRENPKLVVCSITGYGQAGPLAQAPGHDINYLARSGLMHLLRPREGAAPPVPAFQIADVVGGSLLGAVRVLAALYQARATGVGAHLDIAMTQGATAAMVMELARRSAGEIEPAGLGFLTGELPSYRLYRTRDGRYLALGALEPKFFECFCRLTDLEHLAGLGLARGEEGAQIMRAIESRIAEMPAAEWLQVFDGTEACCELVQTPEEALADPGLRLPKATLAGGVCYSSPFGATQKRSEAPAYAADSLEVARALGVREETIAEAVRVGALVTSTAR